MTRSEAVAHLCATNGSIFSVHVRKRDGTERVMNGRLNVKKGLAGGEPAYDPGEHGLIWFYDMHAQARRSIAIEGILAVSVGGVWMEVVDDPVPVSQDSKVLACPSKS